MNCEILSTLYVRANGEIPCDDDAGERIALGEAVADPAFSVTSVFRNESYASIRAASHRRPSRKSVALGPWVGA